MGETTIEPRVAAALLWRGHRDKIESRPGPRHSGPPMAQPNTQPTAEFSVETMFVICLADLLCSPRIEGRAKNVPSVYPSRAACSPT